MQLKNQINLTRKKVTEMKRKIVIKTNTKSSLPSGISIEFMDYLFQVMNEYDQTLKGLKNR
ncbi:hypothetical protein R50912_13785 [Paenibacillus sp. FSL R5-0912]|nr:hypothetical protein R50912_13785 [Paenibacillus sp. FSL R5-0912]